jgi:integrase
MVQMITPWKHPQTGIYYLYKELPPHLRGEMGRRQVRRSLRTRDPVEAKRLFVQAHAELEREMAEAEARVAAQARADEISPERAIATVDRWLREVKPPRAYGRWPSLASTWWLEDTADRLFGLGGIGAPPPNDDDQDERLRALRDMPLTGDCWLELVRSRPRSVWIKACRMVLDPLFDSADPPIVRIPANEMQLMDAWNAQVVTDNARFHADVNAPRRAGAKPRARPDLRFGELLSLWKDEKQPRPQSFAETAGAVADLVAYVGDVAVASLTADMLMDYRDEAKRLPRTMPRADRSLPFDERIALHADSGLPRVTPTTLKKRIGAIQALLSFAHQQRWIEHHVGTGVRITGYSRKTRNRRSFRHDELSKLFSHELFLRPDRLLERGTRVSDLTLFWLFVLGLTSGARIEEVGQARVADVRTDVGILYIDVDDYAQDDDLPDKSLKTDSSRRVMPIHALALSLGFDMYVDGLRSAGQDMLFPDLQANVFGKLTQEASRRANRLIDSVVTDDSRLVFHSLRHHFKDAGREADVQEHVLDQLCGHAPASVGARYGDGAGIQSLKRSLDRMRFDAVDWPPMIRAAESMDWRKTTQELVARCRRFAKHRS